MTDYFIAAPWIDPDLATLVFGPDEQPAPAAAAVLPGHCTAPGGSSPAPLLVARTGQAAPGAVVALGDRSAARLDFLMIALGARPAQVHALNDGHPRPAVAYLAAAAATGGFDGATGPDPVLLREFVAEVMAHFGRHDAQVMPRLIPGIAFRALARSRGPHTRRPRALGSGFGAGDVASLAIGHPYAQYFGVEEHRLRHRRFDGTMSRNLDRAVFASGDGVTVLPFDPVRQAVLLIEQFRIGAHARHDPAPWFLEAVAGRCDAVESPPAAARREAREEAGLDLGRLEQVAAYYTSPGVCSEFITAFVGEADLGGAGGLHGLAAEDEDIRALVVPLDTALGLVASGEANTAPMMLTLLWLAHHHVRLTRLWTGAAP